MTNDSPPSAAVIDWVSSTHSRTESTRATRASVARQQYRGRAAIADAARSARARASDYRDVARYTIALHRIDETTKQV